jgi:3-deoxy-manno-octulosonate cytidylyltransferase (CMP-KDO synthetase)
MMTSKNHESGTERCGEVLENTSEHFDVIVNIQGDEPFIEPSQISNLISLFDEKNVKIATLAKKIENYTTLTDKDKVKVFFDNNNNANSFCRNYEIMEEEFHKNNFYKHIGIYSFRADILEKITKLSPSKNEKKLNLEQLRWLDNKFKIKVGITEFESLSVDTTEDIDKIVELHSKNS